MFLWWLNRSIKDLTLPEPSPSEIIDNDLFSAPACSSLKCFISNQRSTHTSSQGATSCQHRACGPGQVSILAGCHSLGSQLNLHGNSPLFSQVFNYGNSDLQQNKNKKKKNSYENGYVPLKNNHISSGIISDWITWVWYEHAHASICSSLNSVSRGKILCRVYMEFSNIPGIVPSEGPFWSHTHKQSMVIKRGRDKCCRHWNEEQQIEKVWGSDTA